VDCRCRASPSVDGSTTPHELAGAQYYWTAAETEYATDVMFRDRAALGRIYPALVHHAVMSFGSEQVLRFMGRSGKPGLHDDVQSNRRGWEDGVRVKHWVNKNSLKAYDKDSILRVEATVNEPKDFRSYRSAEKKPGGPKRWRILRRSVADFYRRAEVSRAATERYLTALSAVHGKTSLGEQAAQVCRAVRRNGRRYRALNPLAEGDAQLMAIVNRGEFALNGFRNRDLRLHLYLPTQDKHKQRQEMAAVGRRLQLFRAHGLIARVPKTHRYTVTKKGRNVITAFLAARQASTEELTALAA
jgi:ribosomal protein L36